MCNLLSSYPAKFHAIQLILHVSVTYVGEKDTHFWPSWFKKWVADPNCELNLKLHQLKRIVLWASQDHSLGASKVHFVFLERGESLLTLYLVRRGYFKVAFHTIAKINWKNEKIFY